MESAKNLALVIIERLDEEPEKIMKQVEPALGTEPFRSMSKSDLTKNNIKYGYMLGYMHGFAGALNVGEYGLSIEEAQEAIAMVTEFINAHRPASGKN